MPFNNLIFLFMHMNKWISNHQKNYENQRKILYWMHIDTLLFSKINKIFFSVFSQEWARQKKLTLTIRTTQLYRLEDMFKHVWPVSKYNPTPYNSSTIASSCCSSSVCTSSGGSFGGKADTSTDEQTPQTKNH